ncbi:HpcH/HpaI aldolase/citrate lyase family protein [Nakamurella multipartita]|uniref:HpcH/HpaI aldolase n=1 Tax=Nakamurella multipartita (strain ATCC 700099 / DSM 44233 / CIP 104796 / JCM 9543 / NBRC 105858 / Y-104) TaxID=479431 RepID=C8XBI5_NAKMY|nr:aldolase/citrate lyase family protein [Nakamurella multipartita]ACV77447.1 HpcH/HpaI aldolase [Nakamurella multipartita DSM 44233]
MRTPVSYLFVPGHRPDLIAKSARSGADAVVVDLEDAVAPADRPAARATVREALLARREAPTGQQCWVRINQPGTADAEADLAALGDLLTHARVPKVDDPAQIDWVAARAPHLRTTLPAIESAAGLLAAPAIAAHPRVCRLGLGGVDLANDLGCDGSAAALAYPRSVLVVASRAAGLPGPVNSVYAKLDDPEGLLAHARAARAIGFGAQSALTPRQLPAITQVFGLAPERITWAREVLDAFRAAGGAACRTPSGDFVDLPVAQEAQRILAAV